MVDTEVIVSIIVPIYNVESYLDKCLSSILNQTFGEFEVLLVDDGSTDKSPDICSKYVNIDRRFKYIKKENGGLSDARNYGIANAQGKYLIFIDSDDYVKDTYIDHMLKAIESNKCDIAICGFYRVNGEHDVIDSIKLTMIKERVVSGLTVIKKSFDENGWALACAWNKIYKKEIFNNLQFAKGRYYEDGFIFPSLFLNVKRVCIVQENLYFYVQRNNSIMHSGMNIKKLKDGNLSLINKINTLKSTHDTELYILAIQDYKNWILSTWIENRTLINDHKLRPYFQNQYRKCVKVSHPFTTKSLIKDVLGYINLDFFFLIRKSIN